VPTVAANGIEIYFERRGKGPRLLFFNGSGATLETTAPMIDPFAECFDVLAHDQRGLGKTSIPPGTYEMADYAADAAALLDAVGWESCRIVGVSFGGMVAQEFAVTWPERVDRLALLCTSPGGAFASYPLHELGADRPDDLVRLLDTRYSAEWLATHDDDRLLAQYASERRASPSSGARLRGEQAQLDARSRHDVLDRLHRITCPTLVASGCYDGIAPVTSGEAIASRIRDARLRVYEGGHMFFLQDPAALPEILEFLGS
jgi:3-oxoadipate enol-lactonase